MVNSHLIPSERRFPLALPRRVAWRLPFRRRFVAFWAVAGGLLPALNVAALVLLLDSAGLGLAVATVLVGDLALLVLSAIVTDARGAAGRAAGGLALAIVVTWAVLVAAYLLAWY
jgi:uncharacterized membrane protein YdcZ (DUF606 family)